jgi:hypothetical protein
MERYCLTGQSPWRAVAPMEEEEVVVVVVVVVCVHVHVRVLDLIPR